VYEPGHKFDFAVIIEGLQGRGKSTFIKMLGRNWFAELDGDFHDSKQMIELLQGAWILEIPELSAFSKADVRNIKAFISRSEDRARLAYARRAAGFRRQCIFIGSTNDFQYLADQTGGRRFWPVACTVESIDSSRLADNIDQIWAEALALYREMRRAQPIGTLPLHLRRDESQAIAAEFQQSRTRESSEALMAGVIEAWLETPICSGGFDEREGQRRDSVCAIEIFNECLKEDGSVYSQGRAQAIGRAMDLIEGWEKRGMEVFGKYGKQRAFRRRYTPKIGATGLNVEHERTAPLG
jgi:predicted P-loop ATPase